MSGAVEVEFSYVRILSTPTDSELYRYQYQEVAVCDEKNGSFGGQVS